MIELALMFVILIATGKVGRWRGYLSDSASHGV